MIDVGLAIGVDVREGRHHFGQVGHVLPGQQNAGGAGDGRHMQGMVGGTTGGMQGNNGVDQATLVDDLADGHETPALLGQARDLLRGFTGQRLA